MNGMVDLLTIRNSIERQLENCKNKDDELQQRLDNIEKEIEQMTNSMHERGWL